MRKIALLLLVFVLPLFAGTFQNLTVRDGDDSYASFEKEGVTYVITDPAMLKRINAVVQPQVDLGHEQARLGTEQARIGGLQAQVGAEQAALGAQQAASWDDSARMRELEAKQRKLQRRQAELAEQQRPLAEKQEVLAEKQREASARAQKGLEKLFDEALRTGVAKRR
jgi:septal ring factor EnvC (AmiA/AmiB activator)